MKKIRKTPDAPSIQEVTVRTRARKSQKGPVPEKGLKGASKSAVTPPQSNLLRLPPGVLIGAHTSTSGGVSQAIVRAQTCGFTAAQIFVKNNKQWFAPPISDAEAAAFRAARKASGIYFFAHNSYLINLGSPDPELFSTSVRAMIAELERAEALAFPFIVMHPGSHGGAGGGGRSQTHCAGPR